MDRIKLNIININSLHCVTIAYETKKMNLNFLNCIMHIAHHKHNCVHGKLVL